MFGRSSQANIIFIIILIMFAISQASFDLQTTLLTLPGLILALTLHEYAHARVSDRLGDPTPSEQGRLTLNPLAHLDPVGTIFLIFAGFGWGKPVQIDSRYYRNPARDMMLVSLAGPVSNFIQSIVWFFIYGALITFVPLESSYPLQMLTAMVLYAALINVSLGVFNLLPLPPLDGSKILRYFVHGKGGRILDFLENYSTIILLVLFMTDLTGFIISPIINWITTGMLWLVQLVFSLF
ncbi:MAG: site-2 protease family protein [Clostridia bacterium]|nr:site-2 protease family protein [Clostridia bacterium]